MQGIDHWIYFIDKYPKYILRVTKPRAGRPYNGQEMQTRDIALRKYLRSVYLDGGLGGDIITQSITTWSAICDNDNTATGDGEYCASLETRLYGSPLRAPISDTTIQDLVTFFSIMKGVDLDTLDEKLGFKILEMYFSDLQALRISAIDAWHRMVERGQISAEDIGLNVSGNQQLSLNHNQYSTKHFLASQTACIEKIRNPNKTTTFSLVHDDLKSEHILIDQSSGQITAILDWADAGRGNSAVHVSGLALTIGKRLAVEVAERAGYVEDTILQGIVQARCECTLRLDDRLNGRGGPAPIQLLRDHLFLSLED